MVHFARYVFLVVNTEEVFLPQNAPGHSEVLPVAAEGRHLARGAQEAEKTHVAPSATHEKMELAGTRPAHARAPPGAPVLLNCVKPTHETLFADVPNLSIENATKMSKDRKLWSSNRPSLRCQTLSGGVAIK